MKVALHMPWRWTMNSKLYPALVAGVLALAACSHQAPDAASASTDGAEKSLGQKLKAVVSSEVEIPAGTELDVRLVQSLGSANSSTGQKFEATLHKPIVV